MKPGFVDRSARSPDLINPQDPPRGPGDEIRVARDLNRAGLWTIYRKSRQGWKPSEKVEGLKLEAVRWKVSRAGIERIRTPKDERTSSGARGLGRRTVCAFAVGKLAAITDGSELSQSRPTIRFNPFKHEGFMLQKDGEQVPAPEGLTLVFLTDGRVEVVA